MYLHVYKVRCLLSERVGAAAYIEQAKGEGTFQTLSYKFILRLMFANRCND